MLQVLDSVCCSPSRLMVGLQAKQERLADKTMSNMSKQLDELIRQGQQALGTKIEVEGDTEDEVYVDEHW